MKKGITSLDALTAFLILIFLVIFIQNSTSASLANSDQYGALMQAKQNSQNLASIMNTFYAANFSAKANVTGLNRYAEASFFGEKESTVQVLKNQNNLTTTILTGGKEYSSSAPAVVEIKYNQVTGVVSK